MEAIILQLFKLFAPIVQSIIAKHKAANDGADPTDAEVLADFKANLTMYLGEGAAWKAAKGRG